MGDTPNRRGNFRGRGGPPRGGQRGGRGGRDGPNRGGRPQQRGGGPRGGFRGGSTVAVRKHPRFEGVYIAHQKGDIIVTRNLVPKQSVYGEKLITVDSEEGPVEYREWNPFRSKIGSCLLIGPETFGIVPGSTVLYLGAASGTTVSHVSDLVGSSGAVYAVEFSHRVGRELVNLAKTRPNIIPIIDDARHPQKYRMLVPAVDVMFADVAQPDQARIFVLNGEYFLKNNGKFLFCIKASCVDSTVPPEHVFAQQKEELTRSQFRVEEAIDLEQHHRGHAMLIGTYRPT